MMLLITKLTARLLFPMPLCLILLFAGLALLWLTRRQRLGKICVTLATFLLLILSLPPLAGWSLNYLEQDYPGYVVNPTNASDIKYVVVLGGGAKIEPQWPLTSCLGKPTLVRLIEGIRLHQALPKSKLVVSGGSFLSNCAEADLMAMLAKNLGVATNAIIVENKSRNTEEEAQYLTPTVGQEPFLLVTSASHMRRSLYLFTRAGLKPIPAPTEHISSTIGTISILHWVPSAGAIVSTERLVYEVLGLWWAILKQQKTP